MHLKYSTRYLLIGLYSACLYHCSVQPAHSFPGYMHVDGNPDIPHARSLSPTAYLLKCNSSSLKAQQRYYSTHPILKTAPGQRFKGTLTHKDWNELSNLYFDANYIKHAKAESDAAETFCKLAKAGKIDFAPQHTAEPHNFTVAIGFNQIPVKVQMIGNNCENASVQPGDYSEYTVSSPYGGGKGIQHPVLGLSEFEQLDKRALSDNELRLLTVDPGTETFHERVYIGSWHCFRTAESEAAIQFRNRVLGCSKIEILNAVGTPMVKTGPVSALGDTGKDISNWIYYLGLEGIPVRLVIEEGRCIAAGILSQKQEQKYFFDILRSFAAPTQGLPADEKTRTGIGHSALEGKTLSQILEQYGEPLSITTDEHGHSVYIYGLRKNTHIEIPIANGKVEGRISLLQLLGYPRKSSTPNANTGHRFSSFRDSPTNKNPKQL